MTLSGYFMSNSVKEGTWIIIYAYGSYHTRKLSYRKDDRAMHPIYRCPENFPVPEFAHGYFSQNF